MAEPELQRRTRRMGLVLLLVLLLLAGRMWQLQIVHGEHYAALADGNRMRRLSIPAPRGVIRDREGRVLADNRLAFTVSIVPGGLVDNREAVVERLSRILGRSPAEIEAALQADQRAYPYEPLRVARDVPPEVAVAVEEQRMDLPGVMVEQEPIRRYPAGSTASHVLGYLQLASPEDLAAYQGYRPSDLVGRIGIERAYEEHLRGERGFQQVEVNALSRPIRVLGSVPPVPGNDLVLTVDAELQRAATEAVAEQLERLKREPGRLGPPGGGAVVVLDVKTGAVLALVSYPEYDPNMFLTGDRGAYFAQLERDPLSPLFNRAIQGVYAPGSSFKPVTLLAALERRVTTPDEVYVATGVVDVGGRLFRDWTVTRGLPPAGPVDAVTAMERSVNDYFYVMGSRAGIQAIAATARALGLGRSTGLDIRPQDAAGLVPDPAWKRAAHGELWYPGDTANVSIGQGFLQVTPLQLAVMYAGLANRGAVYEPYLVQAIISPSGEEIYRREPRLLSYLEASPASWNTVHRSLLAVTSGERGTARSAFERFPIPVAGKTGSAQVAPRRDTHAWFAAYAPADNPEVAVAVLLEYGGGGGAAAAPVACRVLAAYFHLEGDVCP
ncbi:MAG: penicillin-binding protein 2 [Bacillota bacterium]|nr:penicillin-binding protein 2 [Bacillota bacterium]REJ36998.1 MAG: penicillin-binding protein 2 [Bacillota bacterium]